MATVRPDKDTHASCTIPSVESAPLVDTLPCVRLFVESHIYFIQIFFLCVKFPTSIKYDYQNPLNKTAKAMLWLNFRKACLPLCQQHAYFNVSSDELKQIKQEWTQGPLTLISTSPLSYIPVLAILLEHK